MSITLFGSTERRLKAAFFVAVRARAIALARAMLLVSLLSSFPLAAQDENPLVLTRRLAEAGAHQLVLDRVTRLQPQDRSGAGWNEWEALRCQALDALGRHADLVDRAAAVPAGVQADALAPCMVSAARASFALQRYAEARRYAARALWQARVSAADAQALRRLNIDASVGERRGDEAYRAMLRFQQDYAPLSRDIAAQFVSALVELGMEKEALTWLPHVDDAHPAKLALRVRAGLLTADAATAQARAALAKGADAAQWSVLADVLSGPEQWPLRIAVYEQSLNRGIARASDAARGARRLWSAYLAAAVDVANRSRLLVGDDAGWADYAGRRLGTEPAVARALFAHLTQHARTAATRHNAQLQLLHSYQGDRLELVALRVFESVFADADALDTQVRYRLGAIAEAGNSPAAALRYWRDLPPPPDASAGDWLQRLSRQRWRAGNEDIGMDALARQYAAEKQVAAVSLQQSLRYADELNEAGRHAAARTLLQALLPHATPAQSRALHAALGRAHEGAGEYALAADAYMRAALLGSSATDAAAAHARLRAGLALVRAGYVRDARAQLEWVTGNAKDPAMADAARRELVRLQP